MLDRVQPPLTVPHKPPTLHEHKDASETSCTERDAQNHNESQGPYKLKFEHILAGHFLQCLVAPTTVQSLHHLQRLDVFTRVSPSSRALHPAISISAQQAEQVS